MFTWAVIDLENNVLSIQRATLDVPTTRPYEHWVIVQDGVKWKENLIYNPITKEVENG